MHIPEFGLLLGLFLRLKLDVVVHRLGRRKSRAVTGEIVMLTTPCRLCDVNSSGSSSWAGAGKRVLILVDWVML